MNNEKWNKFWNNYKSTTLEKLGGLNIEKNAIKNVFDKIGIDKKASIVDFGCGMGRTLEYIRAFGFKNSIGVDISENAIRKCEIRGFKKNHDVFFSTKRKFNLLFCEGLLEHYKKEEWDSIIKSMTDISKEYIVLLQPLLNSFSFKLIDYIHKRSSKAHSYIKEYDYNISEFVKAFEKYGFLPLFIKTTHRLPKFLDISIILVFKKK